MALATTIFAERSINSYFVDIQFPGRLGKRGEYLPRFDALDWLARRRGRRDFQVVFLGVLLAAPGTTQLLYMFGRKRLALAVRRNLRLH